MNMFMRIALLLIFILPFNCAGEEKAQKPFQDMMVNALFDKRVRKELELSSEQKGSIDELLKPLAKEHKQMEKQIKEFSKTGAAENEMEQFKLGLHEQFLARKSEVEQQVVKTLLPHQIGRLKRMSIHKMLQHSAKQSKEPSELLSPQIRQYLKINDKQADKIRTKALELQKELREKIQELQKKAHDELFRELDSKQRKKFEELVGETEK